MRAMFCRDWLCESQMSPLGAASASFGSVMVNFTLSDGRCGEGACPAGWPVNKYSTTLQEDSFSVAEGVDVAIDLVSGWWAPSVPFGVCHDLKCARVLPNTGRGDSRRSVGRQPIGCLSSACRSHSRLQLREKSRSGASRVILPFHDPVQQPLPGEQQLPRPVAVRISLQRLLRPPHQDHSRALAGLGHEVSPYDTRNGGRMRSCLRHRNDLTREG